MKREWVLPLVFSLAVLFGLLGCPLYASAQSTAAKPATNSPDVAGSGGNLSTYSNSSSLQALGIDTTQPQRTDDQGNTADKNENPFGTSNKILVNNMSVATAGIGDKRFNIKDVKDRKLIDGSAVMTDNSSDDWAKLPKVMTSANIKGTSGYQQVLTAVLVPVTGSTYDLKLVIEDYNGGGKANTPARYTITVAQGITMKDAYMNFSGSIPEGQLNPDQMPFSDNDYTFPSGTRPSEIYKSHFRMVACAGRVAILVDRTLYDYKLTFSGNSYSAVLLRSTTFNGSSSLAPIAAGDTPLIDLKAGDPNGDGLQELVMTVSSAEGTNPGHLLIYQWENNNDSSFGQPLYNLNPSQVYVNGKELDISVAVGNITGSGDAILMGHYFKDDPRWYWSYVMYDHTKSQFVYYRANPNEGITKNNDTNVKAKALPVMTCVSFSAPQADAAQYVFYDGFVLQYNPGTKNLDVIYSPPQLIESIPKSKLLPATIIGSGEIQRPVEAIYSDTVVGNLFNSSSDKPLPQQLAVILQDTTFGTYNDRLYFVDKGQITSALDPSIFRLDRVLIPTDKFVRPALTGAVVKGKYSSLQFVSASFAMSDPKVVAVLGASPYYKEFENEYGNGWGNEATTYGTSETNSTEKSQGFTLTAGATIGADVEISGGFIVSEKIAEFEAEVNVTDEFTREWSTAKSVTIGRSFSAVADDMVVISSIPYDIYKFRICDPGNKDRDGKLTTLYVPYEPRISLMNLTDYNDAVAKINQRKNGTIADAVPDTVLGQHAVGDPRTYPSGVDSSKFQNINQKSVITGGEFLGVGTGNGLSEQNIATGTESSSSFNNAINLDVSFKATVGSLVLGTSRGLGYNAGMTISNGSSTELSGSVVNLPSRKQNYDFTWKLVGYQVNLPSGSCCPVVNYLVKTAQVPPPVPKNLQLLSYGGTSAAIGWDAVQDSNLSKYLIYRSTSKDIDTAKDLYDTLTIFPKWVIGQSPPQVKYQDTKLEQGQQYYYEIVAEASYQGALLDSQPSDALAVPALVTGLTIKSQPQLQYNDGDSLNLSGLVLTADLSDGKTKDLTLPDLKKRGVTFSIPNGTILSLDDSGVPIYITDPLTRLLVVTDPLTVTKGSINSSVSSISFTVGSTDNATWLAAGQKLTAHIGITNKQSSPESVIAIVALFDPNGSMYAVNYSSQTIAAGGSKIIDVGGFTLPSPIGGYAAKAFLVEGTQFDTSSLRPMSNIGQIGAQSSGSGGNDATAKSQTTGNVTYVINP